MDEPQATPAVTVHFDGAANRFVAAVPGATDVAFIDVAPGASTWVFKHTEVPPSLAGRGVGSELVRQALAHVRAVGAMVKPSCPFSAAYIKRHPEERDLVRPRHMHLVER